MVDEQVLCNCTRGEDLHFGDCLIKFYKREKALYEGWCRDKDNYPDNFNHLIEMTFSRFEFIREPVPNQVYLFDSLVKVNREFLFECYKRYKQTKMEIILIEERVIFLERQYDTLRDHFVDYQAHPLNG